MGDPPGFLSDSSSRWIERAFVEQAFEHGHAPACMDIHASGCIIMRTTGPGRRTDAPTSWRHVADSFPGRRTFRAPSGRFRTFYGDKLPIHFRYATLVPCRSVDRPDRKMRAMHKHKSVSEGPAIPLSDVLASDGVERPVIGPVRRFDYDDRTGADLERAATALLRNAGDLAAWNLAPAPYAAADGEIRTPGLHHIDTVHRYTRQPQVAPDQIARHGVTRYELPSAARYRKPEHKLTAVELVDTGTPGTEMIRTRLVTDVVGRGYAFIGHESTRDASARGATSATRTSSTPKRSRGGQTANVWTATDRTIRTRWSKATQEQRDHAQHLAATIRERGSVTVSGVAVELTLAPRERVTIVAGDERLTGGSFTLDDYVRRATLESVK